MPTPVKNKARRNIRRFLAKHGNSRPIYLRISSVASASVVEDASAIVAAKTAGLVLPKVERPETVSSVKKILAMARIANLELVAQIETTLGVVNCHSIASQPGVTAVTF